MSGKSVIGTIGRVLGYVAFCALVGIGSLLVIVAVFILVDGGDTGAVVASAILGAAAVAMGFALLAGLRKSAGQAHQTAAAASASGAAAAYPGPDDTNPRLVITPSAQTPEAAARVTFDRLVLRSTDIIATLRDVAAHNRASHPLLAEMLDRAGVTSWTGAPRMDAAKLSRNGRFWLNAPIGRLDADDVDRVLAAEAALNIEQDVVLKSLPADESGIAKVLASVSELDVSYSDDFGRMDAETLTSATDGEWNCRLRIADFLENAPAPFRISFDMQTNLREGLAEVAVDVPRPDSLSVLTADPARQVVAARAYALRSALLAARAALGSSRRVKRVTVHCNEPSSQDGFSTLMRLTATPETIPGLLAAARDPAIDTNGFPRDEAVEATFDSRGWFVPICVWSGFTTAGLDVAGRFDPVEANDTPCPEPLAMATGARTYADLGINESGGRVAAWNGIVGQLGESTGSAVSALMTLRNTAHDLSVAEAADRTSKALVEGSVDSSDREAMAQVFVNGSALDVATRRARKVLDDDPNPDEAAGVLATLEGSLAPIAETGMYLDDPDCVYRYFNSVGERFAYNRAFSDDTRTVKLVPDSYYMAHSIAARLNASLDDVDRALAHADELIRIAPMTTDAALVKVRILEDATRVFEAADLLKEYVNKSSTVRDMAICLYRLAFMEWKLGRSDLAVACYQRSINLFPANAAQAEQELSDLVESDEGLRRLANDDEVRDVLAKGGLPCGPVGELRVRSLAAAMACVDANVFSVARPMLGIAIDANRDDALSDVHRSLKPLG